MHLLTTIKSSDQLNFLRVLTHWANDFEYASVLNSNTYGDIYGKYLLLAGLGHKRVFSNNSIEELREFYKESQAWLFGHLSYDLKNQLENLDSQNAEQFSFGDICFFEPQLLVKQERGTNEIEIWGEGGESLKGLELHLKQTKEKKFDFPDLKAKMSRDEYLAAITTLKNEIQLGNIYEINYCQEFFAEEVELDTVSTYLKLNKTSAMPFSAFYKKQENTLMCASPERSICKRGNEIYSQPIKGTIKRGKTEEEDEALKVILKSDLKEQTENVMIVDLVRNDLSRTAAVGSVKVEELFGVYPYPQVHQLISTVSSELHSEKDIFDVLATTFPMGSMTGAPKISAMKLADKYEESRRELYSGSVGYITPEGDFDFNVVIRSLMYSETNCRLSLMVGGAITNLAEADKEYEECLLKAKAILELGKDK